MENNVYKSPQSNVGEKEKFEGMVKVYTPTQVACGALVGGPIGLVYFLWANFKSLMQESKAKNTLLIGIVAVVFFVFTLPFIPDGIPSSVSTVVYILIGKFVAERMQMTKDDIFASENHDFFSNWRVFGLGLVCLAGSTIVILVPIFTLVYVGWLDPT